jgi:ferredoxin
VVSRVKMRFRVEIEDCDQSFSCAEDQTVLRSTETGLTRRIPVGCRQGGCGVCRVQVLEGTYRVRVMSRAHITPEDQAQGRVLACCIWPTSDLRIRVLGRKKKGDDICQ